MSTVLVTGGCGFIGSHQAVNLLEDGHDVVIVDDLSNSDAGVLERITALAGRAPRFHQLDVRDTSAMEAVVGDHGCTAIIHFAGRKHVAESMEVPVDYLEGNVNGLLSVVRAADRVGVRRLIFSSSGSVYGNADTFPIPEAAPFRPSNPYSASKAVCEQVLSALCAADRRWSAIALRYFNPAGAHPSGLIGEQSSIVSNIVPVVMEVAAGRRDHVVVHGVDLPTPDGTAVRDFIHVMDVAEAHARAVDLVARSTGFEVLNVGRGIGVSVREVIAAAERVVGRALPVVEGEPRPGDVPVLYGDTSRAERRLGRHAVRDIDDICRDAWRFRSSVEPVDLLSGR